MSSQRRAQDPSQVRQKVAYVVKMYPRFSETFIVSEILAHEAAGLPVEIFSLRATTDTHFQDLISRVRSPVHYISSDRPRVPDFWMTLATAGEVLPGFWESLGAFAREDPRDVLQGARLALELRAGGFTHIHAHFASVATTVARIASRLSRIPYSFTAHAKDIFHETVDGVDFRRKLADASAVATVSLHNLEYLRASYGSHASVVRRIYNGLDLDEFAFTSPLKRERLIIGVGRLVEKKGFDDLIRACSLLKERRVKFRCEIIGGGLMEPSLRSLIDELDVSDVIEMRGPLPQNEVRKRVVAASLLAAPCVTGEDGNRDGLPTVLLEAMALGTPCVSTPVAGIPEAVRDGDTGLMVGERDVNGLASELLRLLDDPDLRCRLAASARRLMEEQFDLHRNTAQLRRLFSHYDAAGAEAA